MTEPATTGPPTDPPSAPPNRPTSGLSRRGFLGVGLGALGAGAVAGSGITWAAEREEGEVDSSAGAPTSYPFFGEHQPGITTDVQDRLHFAAFDVVTESRAELIALLQAWTAAADRMMRGEPAGVQGPISGPYHAPPDDTGEAIGLPPARLTLTFGFGPSLFVTDDGRDRFGLAERRPEALEKLPHFPTDKLDPARSDGDLCVQACADDPQVAVHAIRNLARIGFGVVSVRWSQLGFGRTSTTTTGQDTPRNLFGFKDGTMNIKSDQADDIDEHVWVPAGRDPREDWLVGGSYLVARRISMTIEVWDRQALGHQEEIIGRTKGEGAPLSGGSEFDQPNFKVKGNTGEPLVAPDSHVAIAHPSHNKGRRMLRRGYNFVDGSTELGRLDAGLFFLAYLTDPRTHFIPLQTKMAKQDLMQEYVQHTGSALWAVPPGVPGPDSFVGATLFTTR
jgi:deferrochelatase/peroxidase EfeB